jgi:hypothetical protein
MIVEIRKNRVLELIREIASTSDADLRDIEAALEEIIEETTTYLSSIEYDIARLSEKRERAFEDGQVL